MTDPYTIERYPNAPAGVVSFQVVGPGVGGWSGIIPRTHDGMTQRAAADLAGLLNTAHRMGQLEKIRQFQRVLQGID